MPTNEFTFQMSSSYVNVGLLHPFTEQRLRSSPRNPSLDVDSSCSGGRVLRTTFVAARYYQTKKQLDVSCKYPTTVRVIAYKVIFKWSFKHPHNGFGCLLADHVTPPE